MEYFESIITAIKIILSTDPPICQKKHWKLCADEFKDNQSTDKKYSDVCNIKPTNMKQ